MLNIIFVVSFFLVLKYVPSGFGFGICMLFFGSVVGVWVLGSTTSENKKNLFFKIFVVMGRTLLAICSILIGIGALTGFLKGIYPDYTTFNFISDVDSYLRVTVGEIKGQEKEISVSPIWLLFSFIPCIFGMLITSKLKAAIEKWEKSPKQIDL